MLWCARLKRIQHIEYPHSFHEGANYVKQVVSYLKTTSIPSSLIVKVILTIFMRASAQQYNWANVE